ncbi:ArsR/SmtB family transcription factor [Endozoicomonas ascidiicola]|uniref:ArsR/SmtB family transcription factor n=1 Tax=Endozoicomonas ascidiicola TaxID=1698521 RepID=UPI00083316C1|nr:metalloregulator ArsR/SmtB family transcription factor [Endozoicomonas ascidiicola]
MSPVNELEMYARILKELGHSARLAIYKRLVKTGEAGLSVGDLQKELNIPGSTLSHHLSALISAGLVRQVRAGRTLFCIPQIELFQQLLGFLYEECCSDAA